MIADTGAGLRACKASVDLFGLEKSDFVPQVQEIITVGEFYDKAAGGAGGLAVGAGGVWVTSPYAGTVSRIDPAANVVRRTVTVGNRPQGVAVADGQVWVGAGPADTGHRGGTLTVLTAGYGDTMDPVLTQNLGYVLPLAYDGLTAYQRVGGSGSNQLVPDLAVSLPSATDAGTTYTFQLRAGIRYSNGAPLRPEDFRRALERDLILGGNDFYGGPFAAVVGAPLAPPPPAAATFHRGWSSTTRPTPSPSTWWRPTPSSWTG